MSLNTILSNAAERTFDAEKERTDYLQEKGEKLLLGFTALTGLQLFDLSVRAHSLAAGWPRNLFFGTWAALIGSLALILRSMRTAPFQGYPRGDGLAVALRGSTEDEAEARVANMLFAAAEANAKLNDGKARGVRWGTRLLLLALLLAVADRAFVEFVPPSFHEPAPASGAVR